MPKRNEVLDDSDDDSLFDEPQKPSRKFSGTDDEPVDDETGEALFDDLTPRLRNIEIGDELDEEEEEEDLSAADSAASEEEEEEEPASRGGKWSKRLERERRLREEAEANFNDLQTRLARLEQTTTARASDETFTKEKAASDAAIADLRTKLHEAKENGDTALETSLSEQLMDAKIEIRAKEIAHNQAKEAAKTTASDGGTTIVARKVNAWIRKHPRYTTDAKFAAYAKAVDKEMAAEGLSPETDKYYDEMDKRLAERFPEEYKAARKDPPRSKHPSSNFPRNATSGKPKSTFAVKNGRVSLTKRQAENMRNFGLDPTSESDRKEYVINNR